MSARPWGMLVACACIAYAVFVATAFLHELAHGLVLHALGADRVTLFRGAIRSHGLGRLTSTETIEVLVAGPIVTFVQGLLGLVIVHRVRRRATVWRLAAFWIAYIGLAYGGVALAISTMEGSDVGRALGAVDAPGWVALAFAPLGASLLVLVVGPWSARAGGRILGRHAPLALPFAWAVVTVAQVAKVGDLPAGPVAMMALPMVQLYRPGGDVEAEREPRLGPRTLIAVLALAAAAVLWSLAIRDGATVA